MRIRYFDWIKGFAILCLLLTHVMDDVEKYPIGIWITSFNMPLFFCVGGILLSVKENSKGYDFSRFLKRRWFSIGVPYFVFCFLIATFYSGLSLISGSELQTRKYFFKIFTFQGMESLWFLPCYFSAELIIRLSLMYKPVRIATGGGIILSLITIMTGDIPQVWYYRLLIKIAVGTVFFFYGYCLNTWKAPEKLPVACSLLMIVMGFFTSQMNGWVGIGGLSFTNPLLFFFNGVVTSTVIISLFLHIDRLIGNKIWMVGRFLSYFGRSSIVIVCTNNLFIEIIRLLDYKITNDYLLRHGFQGCLLFFGIMLLLESVTIKMSEIRTIGFLFGKTNKRDVHM